MAIPRRQQQIMDARPSRRQSPPRPQPAPRGRSGGAAAGAQGQTGKPGSGRGSRFRPSPMPFDSQANREGSELDFESAEASNDLGATRRAEQEQSGLGDEFANNPYSDAAMLKRQRDASSRGALNTAGNSLYSGSTLNRQSEIASRYDQGYQDLTAADARGAAAYQTGTDTAARSYQLGLGKIKEGAINRALESEPAPQAVSKPGSGVHGRIVRRRRPTRRLGGTR